jgi:hexosaminidase
MMESHKSLQKDPWFAGGIWTWNGFAPFNELTIHNTRSAFKALQKEGLENVIMTLWKDNGGECSFFAGLPWHVLRCGVQKRDC